jgi:hypothetical protein
MESRGVDVECTVPPPEMCLVEGKKKLTSLVKGVTLGFRMYGTSARREQKLRVKVEEGLKDGAGDAGEVLVEACTGVGGGQGGISSDGCAQGSVEAEAETTENKECELSGVDVCVADVVSVADDLAAEASASNNAVELLAVVEEKRELEEHFSKMGGLLEEESPVNGANAGGFALAVHDEIANPIGVLSEELDVVNVAISPDGISRRHDPKYDHSRDASRDNLEGTTTQELAEMEGTDDALPVSIAVTVGHPGRRYSLERHEEEDRQDVSIAQVTI